MSNYLVLDIGGIYIKYPLMTEEKILEQGQIKTIKESFAAFIDQLKILFRSYRSKVEGLAISMPGVINPQEGFAFHGGALWFIKDTPLKTILEKELNNRVSIENDGKSSAMGELWKGKLVNVTNGVVIVLGTGIGGGIIVNEELLRGAYFSAGEFSSIQTDGLHLYSIDKIFGEKASLINLVQEAALIADQNLKTFTGKKLFKMLERGNVEKNYLMTTVISSVIKL